MKTSIPGKLALKRANNFIEKITSSRGMTLIEILVAMAIVGVIFALSVTGLRTAFDANLKGTASKLASTLRYLSNKAVTDHLYLRVSFDLDAQTYTVEESSEPSLASPEEETDEKDKEEKKKPEKAEGDEVDAVDGEQSADSNEVAESNFSPSESKLLQPVKLPSGVLFKDIRVAYLEGKRAQGKIYTYFFPDGYATPTIINLKDDDDESHYSIEVFPLSGRVKVLGSYHEWEEEKSEGKKWQKK